MKDNMFTIDKFKSSKAEGKKITVLTAYDYTTAQLMDEEGVDVILVGDSLGMVVLGYENTLQVTMDDMLHHTKAVVRGTRNALVVGDMPFLSYHVTVEEAIKNAGRFIQEAGANAVKLEGGSEVSDKIKGIINAKIPVVGHLGLTPQSINIFGGFKVQGKSVEQAQKMIDDAIALEEAGVCAIVLECIPAALAKIISEKLTIPTIGIGAGRDCDGQVLVIHDILGMYDKFTPKFVKKYGEVGEAYRESIRGYLSDVENKTFPEDKHTFSISDDLLKKLY